MREAPTFEEVGGFGLSVGHSAMLCCLSLWAVVICCMMERRAVGRSSGMISLLEEVQRLKEEGADISMDDQDDDEFDLSQLSEAEIKMLMASQTAHRDLDE
eukprot:Tamp_21134.p2 GENE.Tamp_21134~~Tamp_21134.p2  ORF type:complete len:101 (+),score=33.61 Tamp_21134:185-487(+)